MNPQATLQAPRGWGKTTTMIKWARENENRFILTSNRERARQIIREYPDLRDRVSSVRTAADYLENYNGKVEVGFDDWDDSYVDLITPLRSHFKNRKIAFATEVV